MIVYGMPAANTGDTPDSREKALISFLRFLERKLGVKVIRDIRTRPEEPVLEEALRLGVLLREKNVIREFGRMMSFPDEPRIHAWWAICNNPTLHQTGGTAWERDEDALTAALAEALERYIWYTQRDFLGKMPHTSAATIGTYGPFIPPERFAGFSDEQRAADPARRLRPDASYLWTRGLSLVSGAPIYLPAQIVSGIGGAADEPFIRRATTNGLATWPTLAGARLNGLLEIIERDAYMVTWLNQITPPRINLAHLYAEDPSLARAVRLCERYRLRPHVVRLITDAPTHAVMTILEDESGHAPRFSVGLKAHQSLSAAVQKSIMEALRARRGARMKSGRDPSWWKPETPTDEIGHRERIGYWSEPKNADKLTFLTEGPEEPRARAAWEGDDQDAHLKRLLAWCAERSYECVAISLGRSSANPTPWHIELVVVPELQPTYLTETTRAFGGTRLKDVPQRLGYAPREAPFTGAPHPFS